MRFLLHYTFHKLRLLARRVQESDVPSSSDWMTGRIGRNFVDGHNSGIRVCLNGLVDSFRMCVRTDEWWAFVEVLLGGFPFSHLAFFRCTSRSHIPLASRHWDLSIFPFIAGRLFLRCKVAGAWRRTLLSYTMGMPSLKITAKQVSVL
jgi:hypothetical protein